MRLEPRSRTQESVQQIAGQAREIPDQIQRLRYLEGEVTLVPETTPWWGKLRSQGAAVVIAVAATAGLAILVCALFRR